ncbi:MAG: hypothetical protein INH34_18190 [Phycisphaerales bacterium]|nr:hypothetical protein [Phycisphaerales bacterium]
MTKNRHELPRKRPARAAKDEIAEDLPTLEPVADDLPTLEAIEAEAPPAGPVRVAALPGEGEFAVVLQVDVDDMDKKAVADAVKAPLTAACAAAAASLRHRKVLVRFGGEALIGSAVKDLVAELLKPRKPLLVVVQRGMGDEKVAEGKLPEVQVATTDSSAGVQADVATGELEAADLDLALAPHLPALQAAAKGRRVRLVFTGAARPDAALRGKLSELLLLAGARAGAIGERVLFDLDLTDRVRGTTAGDRLTIAVQCADSDETTQDALELALPDHAAACQGKFVRFDLSRPAGGPRARCLSWAREHGAVRVDFGDEVAWPPLLALVAGAEPTLRLQPNGRTTAQTLAALVAEAPAHAAACKGKAIVLDWPAGFALDAEAGKALCEVTGALQPAALACTFGGDLREPFVPDPCAFAQDGATTTVTLDSEAGKPAELLRAIDRRLPGKLAELHGKSVRVQVGGSAALSRTLLRGVCTTLEHAGVARLEVVDGDTVDVLMPTLLAVHKQPGGLRVEARLEGRDAAQIERAVERSLAKLATALPSLAGAAVTIVWPGADGASPHVARLLDLFVGKQADKVLLEAGAGKAQQLHPKPVVAPPPPPAAVAAPAALDVAAAPATAGGAVGPTQLCLLGRRDDVAPPMVVVGVPAGAEPAHLAAVEAELQQHLPRFHGRAVLLVLRADGRDVPVRRVDPLVDLLRRTVPATAAATLFFRGPDAEGRPHFEAVHSRLASVPAGTTFVDPRARRGVAAPQP